MNAKVQNKTSLKYHCIRDKAPHKSVSTAEYHKTSLVRGPSWNKYVSILYKIQGTTQNKPVSITDVKTIMYNTS